MHAKDWNYKKGGGMSNCFIAWSKAVLLAGSAVVLTACASTDRGLLTMSPQSVPVARQHQKSVFVAAEYNNNPRWREQLRFDYAVRFAPGEITKAIQESVKSSKTFRQVFYGPGADYILIVTMVNMDAPERGFDMKVDLETLWTLAEAKTNKIVFKEPVKSTFTATTSQAFEAGARHSIAVRGAIRENISQGLTAISRLKLD